MYGLFTLFSTTVAGSDCTDQLGFWFVACSLLPYVCLYFPAFAFAPAMCGVVQFVFLLCWHWWEDAFSIYWGWAASRWVSLVCSSLFVIVFCWSPRFSHTPEALSGSGTEGYTANEVQHNQAFFALAGWTKPKTPARDNRYHNSGSQLYLLSRAFCFMLCARKSSDSWGIRPFFYTKWPLWVTLTSVRDVIIWWW